MDYNALVERAHRNAVAHGFYEGNPSVITLTMLIITEVGEAVQADRRNLRADRNAYAAAISYEGEALRNANFEKYIKGTVEDEIADVCIRCFDLLGFIGQGYDASRHITDRLKSYDPQKAKGAFSEFCHIAMGVVNRLDRQPIEPEHLADAVALCVMWADWVGFDLEWHITEKMRYNESRPYRHNRKY